MKRGQKTAAKQIIQKLREIEVRTIRGTSLAISCKTERSPSGVIKDECLKQEIFYYLKEAQIVIGIWQNTCNRIRPPSSLGYRPPAPVTFLDLAFQLPMAAAMQ